MDDRDEATITSLIQKLCGAHTSGYQQVMMEETDILLVLDKVKGILLQRPMLLEIKAMTQVLGDIHGQFYDLLHIFDTIGYPGEDNQMLFLGDYVDRGKYGMETAVLLFSYKIQFPDRFHLLRGNHESRAVSRVYGFYEECKSRYNENMWKRFTEVFDCLPVACLISKAILCMHGGLSPHLTSMDDIKKLPRPTDVPPGGLMADLLWADPDKALVTGWAENPRGVSFIFAANVVANFLKEHDLDLIVRAHQVVAHGYELFADGKLITLFSAPNFCGQFENMGGMMTINSSLKISLIFTDGMKKNKKKKEKKRDTRNAEESTVESKQKKKLKKDDEKNNKPDVEKKTKEKDDSPKKKHLNK